MKSHSTKGRICVKCSTWKTRDNFHKHTQCAGGINTVCKTCRKEISKRQWQQKSVEQKMLERAKGRAKRKGIEFNLVVQDIVIPEKCPITLKQFDFNDHKLKPSLDRINPNVGYTKNNVSVISNVANMIKSNYTLDELQAIIRYIEDNE